MKIFHNLKTATIDTQIVFWPSFVDLLTSVLMIFLLVYFLQATLGLEDVEAQFLRQSQNRFKSIFEQEFANEIERKTVQIDSDELNLIQITFSDRILFQSGEYILQTTGRDVLRRCAEVFKMAAESKYEQIQVEGHTDDRPITRSIYPRDNWELSTGRAITVVKFLIEVGLDPTLFSANGYSEYKPISSNLSDTERLKNRRIEIRVVFSIPGKKETGPK